jgi:hypothetical protein
MQLIVNMSKIKGKTREQVSLSGYNRFVKELKDKGWKMMGSVDEYKNTKSKIGAKCPQNHEVFTTHNRFNAGHGCKECGKTQHRKHTIDDISKEFKDRGYTLLETSYTHNHIPLRCICKCGRETSIAYNNFTRNIGGCNDCTNRTTFAEASDIVDKEGCSLIGPDEEFILNATHITYICICGNEHTGPWKTFKNGARCPECTKQKYKETCRELYDVDNSFQYEPFKEKGRQTMIEKFNGPYTMSSNLKETVIATNKTNHGGVHNFATPKGRQLSKEGYEDKYGYTFGNNPEHQEKGRASHKANTGYDFPMQVPATLSKRNASSFSSKEYTFPSGKIAKIQGFEHFALNDLIAKGVEEDDIITGEVNVPQIKYQYKNKTCHYHPDIYIKSVNLLIEIKSKWIMNLNYEQNIKKFQAAAQKYNFFLWVYDKDGTLIEERIFYKTPILNFISS